MIDNTVAKAFGQGLARFPLNHYANGVLAMGAIGKGPLPLRYGYRPLASEENMIILRNMTDAFHGDVGIPVGFETEFVERKLTEKYGVSPRIGQLNDKILRQRFECTVGAAYDEIFFLMLGAGDPCTAEIFQDRCLPVIDAAVRAIRLGEGRKLSAQYLAKEDWGMSQSTRLYIKLKRLTVNAVKKVDVRYEIPWKLMDFDAHVDINTFQ